MPATLTIITCTRNPRPDVLARVIAGVAGLRVPAAYEREYLLIDSASDPPLRSLPVVAAFLARSPWARVVRVEEPGIARARRAGLGAALGELLVWFDDDNVPASDYLEHVAVTAAAHPGVEVWGAGRIKVEFVDPVPTWVDPAMRPLFQERAHAADEFGRATAWAPYFPVGSGMVTRHGALARWVGAVTEGRFTLTGRLGASLASGDDAQIILGAVAAGASVGVVASQSLTHLIPASRCTLGYLVRLEYALAASIRVARAECFPDDALARTREDVGVVRSARTVLARWRRHGWREATLELARRLGARRGATLSSLSRRSTSPPGPPSTP